MSGNRGEQHPDKYIIIPAAHNYVSATENPNEKLGGNNRLEPHVAAVSLKLATVLSQEETIVVRDKAYNWKDVAKWLADVLQSYNKIETYNMFEWLDSSNKTEAFDTYSKREFHGTPKQTVMIVTWCTNPLLAEFLKRKSTLPMEKIDTVKDENFPPQNGKIYIIDNKQKTIQYI